MNILKRNRIENIQYAIIAFVWVLLLATPVLFGNFPDGIKWDHIFKMWSDYALIFVIFLINRFVFIPHLFFKGKRLLYFVSIGILVTGLFGYMVVNEQRPPKNEQRLPPPPRHMQRIQQNPPVKAEVIPAYAHFLILSILIIGFDTGLKISIRWIQSEQDKISLERENVEHKLAFLRNQVSPHFLMNTLNNIHALIDMDSGQAKESTITLSKLMRHLLYDSQADKISLKKEIEFVKAYVALMKLRFSEKVKTTIDHPAELPDISIPPLLFTSFIENAFKHGISYQSESFVNISFAINDGSLLFEVKNSNPWIKKVEEASGIGIENARKRLDLLYGGAYSLVIEDLPDVFAIKLNIPL